jgi:hypothetical protein
MMKNISLLTVATTLVATSSAAFAQETAVVQATNTVVVVTPNNPVVVGGAPVTVAPAGPGAVAPVAATAPLGSDISQINGQLVPVGNHNDYHFSFRKTNVSTNPIGWMMGIYGLSISHALSNNIAVRGDINAMINVFDSNSSGFEAGVTLPLYLRRTYQGPFIEPGVMIRAISSERTDYAYNGTGSSTTTTMDTTTQVGPQVLVGYHWTYDSGFNVAMAFGLQRNLSTEDSYDDGILPAGYLRFGYAF